MRLPEKGGHYPSGAAALLSRLGLDVPLLDQLGEAATQLLDLALEQLELLGRRIELLGARRAVGQEAAGAALLGAEQGRAGGDADHGRAFGHLLGDDRVGA